MVEQQGRAGLWSRRGALGLAVVGSSLFLGGCVGDSPPAPRPLGSMRAAGRDAAGQILYWNQFTGADERSGFEAVHNGFEKTYPELELHTEAIPNTDFITKYTTAVQSESVPDTVMVQVNRFNDMHAMRGLVDITNAVRGWDGYRQIPEKLLTPFVRNDRLFALPSAVFVDWMYYRKDWLEAAGIDAPPTTWNEFRQVAKAITDPAKKRYGFGMRGGDGGGEALIKLIRSYGGPLVGPEGEPRLTKESVGDALQDYSATYVVDKSVPPSAPGDGYNQVFQSFLTGRTGMLFHHTGSMRSVMAALKPGKQVMTAPMPNKDMGWVVPMGNGMMSDDHAAESLAWLEYWASPRPQLDFFAATGYYPAAGPAQHDPAVTGVELVPAARRQFEIGITPEYFIGYDSWTQHSVLVQLQAVLVGRTSVSEAADVVLADFQKNFDSGGSAKS